MARGINKVILVGNLGNDPEVRYSANGAAIANISIATKESWKDKNTGEQQERTEWHRVVMFNRLGEIAGEYLRKGSQVYIEGKLQTRKWQDQSGNDRYSTEIVANEMQMLGGRGGDMGGGSAPSQNRPQSNQGAPSQGASNQGGPQGGPIPGYGGPQGVQQGGSQGGASNSAPAPMNDFDDDIPF